MRHRNSKKRLSQKPHIARMLQRNLVTSMFLYEKIRTTKKRAQVVKPLVDNIMTIAKNNNDAVAIRRINQVLTDKNACRKILEVMKARYKDRNSGFTKMVPVGMRKGDGAMLVDLVFVEGLTVEVPVIENKPKKPAQAKKPTNKKKSPDSSDSSRSSI